MNFRQYFEMHDKWSQSEQAHQAAKQLISTAGGGRFADMADFYMMTYTDEELADIGNDNGDWVGQYVAGSIDSARGSTVLIQIDKHEGVFDMTDTLLHEMGHACWELLDDESKSAWNQNQAGHRWGAEEAFADDFMHFCRGETYEMNNQELFLQITALENDQQRPTNSPQHATPAQDVPNPAQDAVQQD